MTSPPTTDRSSADDASRRRPVRSYVLRAGRLTEGQKRALDELWPLFAVPAGRQMLQFGELFGNDQPVILEVGFGNGDATWQMAAARPDQNFLGVEVHKPGVGHLLLKLEEHRLGNVRIACEDAVELLEKRIPDRSLESIRIYFPDPWPKKRHHKRRIIQDSFVRLMATKMKQGGILHLATDWEPYAEYMLDVMQASQDFVNLSPTGGASPQPEWRPSTKYEKRGERLGHRVFDLVYERLAPDNGD